MMLLAARFGDRNIFQDVVAVRPGQNFTDAMDAALSRSDVVIAVIGPRWLTAAGADGEPRLAKSDDYVRAELTAALAHAKQVIPVLVGGRRSPRRQIFPRASKSSDCDRHCRGLAQRQRAAAGAREP